MQCNTQNKEEKSDKRQKIKQEEKWPKFWMRSYRITKLLKKDPKELRWQSNNNDNHYQSSTIVTNWSKRVWTTGFLLLLERQEVVRQLRSLNTYMKQVSPKRVKLDAPNQEESQQWVWQKESVSKWMLFWVNKSGMQSDFRITLLQEQ